MRRTIAPVLVALTLLAALCAAPASAHPLGNFSINHLTLVRVSADRVDLRYVLDQAEIPTFQQRDLAPAQVLDRVRASVARDVSLVVNGRRIPLRLAAGGRIAFPAGAGGLRTTRVELTLAARVSGRGTVEVRDDTFAGRVGWRAVVVQPGRGTDVRSSVPSADPTHGLRVYPTSFLSSPADRPSATLQVRAGAGTVRAPRLEGVGTETTREHGAEDGLAGTFANAAAGRGVLAFLLLAAFGWGALHALSPGHGKAMVAAYLVGTRGRVRHALGLGLTVTVTHTIGVFVLGLVTLALSQYVVPEDLYPWLNLTSGLLVLVVGVGVLRSRVRRARSGRRPVSHDHGHGPHDHHHGHGHHHHHDHDLTRRGILAMGASAGLIPCPSALVVLLGAIAQHQVGLGLLLIVAFSAGLATTLTALGVAVVHAGRLTTRLGPSRLMAALPAVSAAVILVAGTVLTVQAIPKVVA